MRERRSRASIDALQAIVSRGVEMIECKCDAAAMHRRCDRRYRCCRIVDAVCDVQLRNVSSVLTVDLV
jgi:hypothetical protein